VRDADQIGDLEGELYLYNAVVELSTGKIGRRWGKNGRSVEVFQFRVGATSLLEAGRGEEGYSGAQITLLVRPDNWPPSSIARMSLFQRSVWRAILHNYGAGGGNRTLMGPSGAQFER
jgi:hypothetical protein